MLYLWEIEEQCRYSLKALSAIQAPDADVDNEPWYSIQAFLVAEANISKFLWPTKRGDSIRGKELRALLLVDDTHPLRSRRMRDFFEHFDDKLDSWIAAGKGHHYGRISGTSAFGKLRPTDNGRFFNRNTEVLTFFDEKYNLRLIGKETEILHKRVLKELREMIDVPTMDSQKKSERVP